MAGPIDLEPEEVRAVARQAGTVLMAAVAAEARIPQGRIRFLLAVMVHKKMFGYKPAGALSLAQAVGQEVPEGQ